MCENIKNSPKKYILELLNIAYPIILGNIGFILIGVGDVIVAGRHSTETFASISIANAIIHCIMTISMGLIAGISPLLSNLRGENVKIEKFFYPSIRFSMIMAFLMSIFILLFIPIIPHMGYDPVLQKNIQEYMFISALSTFGGCLHMCLKEFLQAFEIVLFPNLLTIFCVFLNLFLNILFVFGFGAIKPMGVIGLAISSLIVRYFMGFVLLGYCYINMSLKNYSDFSFYKNLIKIGLPISLAIMIEFVAFNSITILLGTFSGTFAATQNLILTLTTISFMIPFAISNAIAVKVGFSNGAGKFNDIKNYSFWGALMSVCFMAFSSVVFISFPKLIVNLFTYDAEIYKLAVPIMIILACFQIFDGLQISLQGILKGLKKTFVLIWANFVAYWLVSLPIGIVLGLKFKYYLAGFWIGILCAGIVLCVFLSIYLKICFKKFQISIPKNFNSSDNI